MEMTEIIKYLSDSKEIIGLGLWAVTFVVFAENGLFFAFFLPGDYLLFLTGVFVGTGFLKYTIVTVMLYLFIAAVLGSLTGFLFGRFFGSTLENRPDRWYFKKKHIKSTEDFFEKYGNRALIISRFLPYIRTFAPILAGISKMNYPKYIFLNVAGAALWVGLLVGGGYYFGVQFPWIINYVHYVILFFLAITTFTVIKGYLNIKKS
jgi:membrane-associated protein